MARITAGAAGGASVCAFLDAIAWSELGPGLLTPATDDGYRVIVGSTPDHLTLFDSYAAHPHQFIDLPRMRITSSAAGRYQFLARTFDALAKQLKLPDFSPVSQDLGAIELIRECHALPNIQSGRIEHAIHQCCSIWASLPGAGYGQGENSLASVMSSYNAALPTYAAEV